MEFCQVKVSKKGTYSKLDEVDRAVANVQQAVDQLVLLILHPDSDLSLKAALAVELVGKLSIRPLTAALAQANCLMHAGALLTVLRGLRPDFDVALIQALVRVPETHPSDRIKDLVEEILGGMRDRSLKLFRKEKPQVPRRPEKGTTASGSDTVMAARPDVLRSR
jgi:hypothetical protein